MSISDIINIILCILSFVLAAISVITVVITLKQNSKMIENSTRPYITIYGKKTECGILKYFLVIKNFGSSGAVITDFHSEIKLEDYSSEYNPNPFRHIIGTHLAPNQSIVCNLNTDKLNADKVEQLPFQIKYFGNKDYVEKPCEQEVAS